MKVAVLDDYQRVALEYADWKSLKGVEVMVFEPASLQGRGNSSWRPSTSSA